jgi:hypothetical protein
LESSTPILVGCGDVTDLTTPVEARRSPMDLIAQAGRQALADAGAPGLAGAIDTVAVLRLFSDTLQAEIDARPHVSLAKQPDGSATLLDQTGERFVANTPRHRELLWDLQDRESLGRRGTVRSEGGRNLFVPDRG